MKFLQAKEDACYVSMDFFGDMHLCQKKGKENTILRDYVLPDYTHIKRGYVKVSALVTGRCLLQPIRYFNSMVLNLFLVVHDSHLRAQYSLRPFLTKLNKSFPNLSALFCQV